MSRVVSDAVLHAKLRWLGAPLLLTGVGLLGKAVYDAFFLGPLWLAAVAALGAGLALASFGANHDTAMGLAYQGREAGLPLDLKDELDAELERIERAFMLRPTPAIAKCIPLLCIQVFARSLDWARERGGRLVGGDRQIWTLRADGTIRGR